MQTVLDDVEFLLCREQDALRIGSHAGPCCRNLARFRNGKLWCLDCKRPRGRLPPKVIAALIAAIGAIPGIKDQTFVLRDKSDLSEATDEYDESTTDTAERYAT